MELCEITPYREALKAARAAFDGKTKRLAAIQDEARSLSDELLKLRRSITALAALCSESPWLDPLGITDSVTEIMEADRWEMTTQDVMKRLVDIGFDLGSQKNPAASVHSVLSRLAQKGKITKVNKTDDEVAWRGPQYNDDLAQSAEISDDDIPF